MLKEVLLGMKKNRLCEILIKPIALFAFVIFPAYVLAHSCVCCFGGEGSSGKVSSVCCPPSACHAGENEIAEIDYYWGKLSAKPEAEQCGWLQDSLPQ